MPDQPAETPQTPQTPVTTGSCVVLSDRDAEQVLAAVLTPPAPNAAAVEAARRLRARGE